MAFSIVFLFIIRELDRSGDGLFNNAKSKIDEKVLEIEAAKKAGITKTYDEMSLLEKLIERYGAESEMPVVMACLL